MCGFSIHSIWHNMLPIAAKFHRTLFSLRLRCAMMGWHGDSKISVAEACPILVTSFHNETLGIGHAGKLTVEALREAGHTVHTDDLRLLHRHLLSKRAKNLPVRCSVWIIHANPPEAQFALFSYKNEDWRSVYRIGYWVWESSLAPAAWVSLAKWFHEIWVPSEFVRNALIAAFVRANRPQFVRKLRVVPHPIPLPALQVAQPSETFKVLTTFDPRSDLERKNPGASIIAWKIAFPMPGDAQLVVKTHSGAPEHPHYGELLKLADGREDILFLPETLNDQANEALMRSASALLSLHRAEGFGLPLAEAMALGIPVIATNWSGNLDFMTSTNSRLVKHTLVSANKRHNGPEAIWAEPDVNDAAQALREMYSDKSLREKTGRNARHDIGQLRRYWLKHNRLVNMLSHPGP